MLRGAPGLQRDQSSSFYFAICKLVGCLGSLLKEGMVVGYDHEGYTIIPGLFSHGDIDAYGRI